MKSSVMTKWLRSGLALCLGVVLALPALAQEDALKAFPGYVDFGELNSIFGEPTVQISIGASLLGLVASLSAEEDPEAAELFKKLNGVRVNVFETESMADGAIDLVNTARGELGAAQNVMQSALASTLNVRENLSAAESRIRDVDVAMETADLTRNSIMQQAAVSILQQANVQPQIALSLLQG